MPCMHIVHNAGPVFAREKVAEWQASGFLFKDTVEVTAVDDPEGQLVLHSCKIISQLSHSSLCASAAVNNKTS